VKRVTFLSTVVIAVLSLLLFFGCAVVVEPQPEPQPELLFQGTDCELHEEGFFSSACGYVAYGPIILADTSSDLKVDFNLRTWDGDYKLELLFMTKANYDDFTSTFGTYSAYHYSLSATGTMTWNLTDILPGVYYFVIDNSNKGWEDTDFDFLDDIAIFDFKIYKMP